VLGSGSFTNFKRGNGDFARKLLNRKTRRRACRKQLHGASVWGYEQLDSRTLSRGVSTLSFRYIQIYKISRRCKVKLISEIGTTNLCFSAKQRRPAINVDYHHYSR
jgi:hypothetical protein